ncbi:MAG: aspartate/glutamate racemase family protein [Bacillota bacterium]|nr:aspartate/glutamate racemase family protein [Bacillota bacterium]MDW7683149.1 aspartate/glutamate racemase family protein [Bacillota bacterium]
MIYQARPGQVSYGEAIGILLLDSCAPFIPGDVANATTYQFPVRFERVPGLTVERIFNHDMSVIHAVTEAAEKLKREGVRAITGDCGFMAIYQDELARRLDLPVFMSSLLQVPFMSLLISPQSKIGVITANARSLDQTVLRPCGADMPERLRICGLEQSPNFSAAFIEEKGILDTEKVETEVVNAAKGLVAADPSVRMLLLECSVLPPYGRAVQKATGLPVFDFVTMINYVYSAVVKQNFSGFM